ncbi:high frequency lysogenization protein HflD [Marinobacter nanhaiticus D15-8W]|uniref:High frequency lysogenization protein HflD homolog n=1 Tax=Marinobacter nanhaiticus D15-8W TaxID=626887 RepID=N6VUD7_9GAMM|nr:high frequency lysogenization protein HflD [Marinobacter nanhaiticus]ENO13730.1 lysogenization regulator HflD [Marinobacter nanhaiticus D15-8W]BES71103.1 high frequency lysogenization protein HflD [Marinobacter nanhaiticus D15-8W]
MSRSLEEQTLALAGVFQSAALVQQIAHRGQCAPSTFETCIRSLFISNPPNTLSVYGELSDLREGLAVLSSLLQKQEGQQDIEILRYALNLVHLESRLRKHKDMLRIIGSRIDQARHTADHFGYNHMNLVNNLASVYTDTISTFRLRIQVTGDPTQLRVEENAARIRALLLAGIRSAVLWRQIGGRRWHLVFYRKRVVEMARRLSEQANQSVFH